MSELMRTMTDGERLRHRLNMNGGDPSVPHRRLIGEAYAEIKRLDSYVEGLKDALLRARVHLKQHCAPALWLIEMIDAALAKNPNPSGEVSQPCAGAGRAASDVAPGGAGQEPIALRGALPCPFCGGTTIAAWRDPGGYLQASCALCDAEAPVGKASTPEEAAATWNRRGAVHEINRAQPARNPGYMIVPIEPTEKMLAAGSAAADGYGTPWTRTANAYKAMVHAAPDVPAVGEFHGVGNEA